MNENEKKIEKKVDKKRMRMRKKRIRMEKKREKREKKTLSEIDHSLNTLLTCAGSIEEILSSITNQYNGNGLQQGASLVINNMLQAELKNNPVLLWMNGDVNYAR